MSLCTFTRKLRFYSPENHWPIPHRPLGEEVPQRGVDASPVKLAGYRGGTHQPVKPRNRDYRPE